jgi:hypothetical protein
MAASASIDRLDGAAVGPSRTLPILTPARSWDADRWYTDFVLTALSTLSRSICLWPIFLDRGTFWHPDPPPSFYWTWSAFTVDKGMRASAVGYRAIDALLAACMLHPGLIAEIIGRGFYIRVPYVLIGPDRKADFPVLYQVSDTVVLHTRSRSLLERRGLRACTFEVSR